MAQLGNTDIYGNLSVTGTTTSNGNFIGNLTGTASKATGDSAGQQITTTYIKGLSVSGKTITYTKGDNSTGTITTQDTTYSSKSAASGGTDVSLVTTGEKYTWNSKANGSHTHNYAGSASAGGPANDFVAGPASDDADRYVYFAYNDTTYNNSTASSVTKGRAVVDSDFKYNPSTNTLTVGTVKGNLTGNASTISLANGTADASRYIIFQDSQNSTSKVTACYDADFKYNPVSNLMNVGSVQLNSKVTLQYNSSTESLDFVFA